jgi:(S)-ureidoglycine aminohydrolase
MQQLGGTRSVSARNYSLFTPDTFVRTPLPGMKGATAIVHASPAHGAAFTQYTAEFEAGGELGATAAQRFVYVLEGEVVVALGRKRHTLQPGGYAYLPDGSEAVTGTAASRATVIEKIYQPLAGVKRPAAFIGSEPSLAGEPLNGDDWLLVRKLVPDQPAFDFAVNTMWYHPGASLSMVEIHVMEHGMLMLEGGGIYRLDSDWHPVTAGDFIWMGPYCPQWFGALGKTPAKYLIYKDWNRHPLAAK